MVQPSDAEPEPEPIEREVLSARVKDRILRWILEGELAPGSRIVETRVARQLGTSQAPVREALRDLATLGFVEIRPYQGSRVRQPSAAELREAIEVRGELEALAGRLAAARITDGEMRQLDRLFEKMAEAGERGDAHEQAVHNTRFHRIIVQAARNRALERAWGVLEPFGRTYVTASMPGVDLRWLGERHSEIIEALRRRDAERAAAALRRHAVEAAGLIANQSGAEIVVPGGGEQ
jgi:DNA-binding GntR family transcriptional regulator